MFLSPPLRGLIVVRAQGKSLRGKINLSLIKLKNFSWIYKKEKEGCTNYAVEGKGVRCLLGFLAV